MTALVLAAAVLVLGCGVSDDSGVGALGGQSMLPLKTADQGDPEPGIEKTPDWDPQAEPPPLLAPWKSVANEPQVPELSREPTGVPQASQTLVPSDLGPGEGPGGGSDEGGDPGAQIPGSSSSYSGLLLLPKPGPWAEVADDILDLCDDSTALFLVMGRALGPGETATQEDLLEMAKLRAGQGVECAEPGGNRYVHVTGWAIGQARPTVQEATDWRRQQDRELASLYGNSWGRFPSGKLLGHTDARGGPNREFPLEDEDSVAILYDTVSLQDGTVRGLVHNLSRTQYARNLEVSVTLPRSGDVQEDRALVWRWPLTVQPGERAPFELEGWPHSDPPEIEALTVSAVLSPTPDIKRSFAISVNHLRSFLDIELHRQLWPESTLAVGEIPTDEVDYNSAVAELMAPESHPELANQVLNQQIQDGRMFIARTDNDGKVYDVVEYTFTAQLNTPITRMITGFLPGGLWQVWAGGANPPPAKQPTGGQAAD